QLQTFKTAGPCKTVEDLTSGAAMSQALHQIDPSWFSESWLARIKEDVGDNVRLKMNNLKKILQMMVDYYNEVLAQKMTEFPLPDLVRVVEQFDQVELGRLLQLILGCAVKCDRKQEYIQIIMTLEESVQHVVMTAIQELMSKETVSQLGTEHLGDFEEQLKKALEDLTEVMAEKEELAQRCQELDVQVTMLQEERNSLLAENDLLTDRSSQLDTFDNPSTPSGRKHSQLQLQLEQLQEENFRLEAAKDDYRIHCEELEKQLVELQHRNDELTSLAEESRALKDELDILRCVCSDRAVKLEASVETYRKKLEDLGDLRRQMRVLEEKNMTYMHNTVSLEEELRKANAARAQLETYKRQGQELHSKLSDESRRGDNLAFEMKKFQEKYDALLKEKERISIERDTLREINEELRCTQAQRLHLNEECFTTEGHLYLCMLIVYVCFSREKFIRLQHENKMLRLQQEESENERITELQEQLEEARRARSQLDTENRLNRERISELQQQVEDLQKALQTQGTKPEDVSVCLSHLVAQDEIMKKKELLEDLQPDATQTSVKMDELAAALKKKDEDMRAMEERYKMYLEKARDVLTLTSSLKYLDYFATDCLMLWSQAKLREYEEKLIVTAWNNKSLNFQKMAIESRLSGRSNSLVPPGQSFLAQQRQVTNARRNMSINVPAPSSK
uniref:Hook microtubule-tethering protein 1 n=1 Tax=Cyprinus carpio carpio TaxID=630221 RepID=A0A8C1F7B2_CYPCA